MRGLLMRAISRLTLTLAVLFSTLSLRAQSVNPRDLQGIWTNATVTPFERPMEFADREFLTEKEAKELEARAAEGRVDRAAAAGRCRELQSVLV